MLNENAYLVVSFTQAVGEGGNRTMPKFFMTEWVQKEFCLIIAMNIWETSTKTQ